MDQILSFLFYQPIVNLLLLLYKILFENLALAVIAITILIRLILWPIYKRQIKAQERIKQIQPKIKELQSKKKKAAEYSDEERKMLAESSKAFGAGCLPLLVQIPFLYALYQVIGNIISDRASKIGDLAYFNFLKFPADYHYNTNFLGLDLSKIPSSIGFNHFVQLLPFLVIILLLIITQFFSAKLMSPGSAPVKNTDDKKLSTKKNAKEEKKEPNPEDMQKIVSQQTMYVLPLVFAFISWNFAAILSVYIIMQNILSVFQTLVNTKGLKIWNPKTLLQKK